MTRLSMFSDRLWAKVLCAQCRKGLAVAMMTAGGAHGDGRVGTITAMRYEPEPTVFGWWYPKCRVPRSVSEQRRDELLAEWSRLASTEHSQRIGVLSVSAE